MRTISIVLMGLTLMLMGCVNSKEFTQQQKQKKEEFNRNPNPYYSNNFAFLFELCEQALFNDVYQSQKLIDQGFRKNNLDITGAPNYLLSRGLASSFVSFTFPYQRTPNQCRMRFSVSPQRDITDPIKMAIEGMGYTGGNRVFQKADRKIMIAAKLSTNVNGSTLLIEINKL